jgi:hypothetical protein
VDDDTIVAYSQFSLGVLSLNGEVKFKQHFNLGVDWIELGARPVRPSANGERFVVAFNEDLSRVMGASPTMLATSGYVSFYGKVLPASFPDHVDVFDLIANQWIYTLKNRKDQFKEIAGLALSPSGDKLAVDSGGVIQVYAIPPRTNPSHPIP